MSQRLLPAFFVSCIAFYLSSSALASIAPYYPPVKEIKYVQRTMPKSDLKVSVHGCGRINAGSFEKTISLNATWKILPPVNSVNPFQSNIDLDKGYSKPGFDDSKWDDINVPLNWYEKYPQARKQDAPYVKAWYRKTVNLKQSYAGNSVLLHFGVIGYEATLFINGKLAGSHHGDYIPWDVDVTKYVRFGATNTIAIRVLSDFGPSFGVKTGAKHSYGDQWGINDIKAGLWQSASIKIVPKVYVSRALITPNLAKSEIDVDYLIINSGSKTVSSGLVGVVQSAMKSAPKDIPANTSLGRLTLSPGTNNGQIKIKLKNPRLWSPDDPYLYYLVLALKNGKDVISAHTERFGYRDFKISGHSFCLNGKKIYLFGENIPSIWYGGNQRSLADESAHIRKSLCDYKSLGYNILRPAHQPIVPEVLEAADEIGMMIYDEWSWAFSNSLDMPVFEKNNLSELTEFIYRDYNHASVVMWSCGNEVNYDGNEVVYKQLNKQVSHVRNLDKSGRPVSSFSGSAFFFGKWKLNTELVDYHTYLGLSAPAWTHWEEDVRKVIDYDRSIYEKNGKFDLPFIVWECIGFSWGQISDENFKIGDVDAYASYASKRSSWGDPNGVGFTGTIGLAAALHPGMGCPYGQEIYGKRIAEIIRYNDRIGGFAPWFINPGLVAATMWTQPVYCGLRTSNALPPTSFFIGQDSRFTFFVVNSSNRKLNELKLDLTIVSSDSKQSKLESYNLKNLSSWHKLEQNLTIRLPENLPPGNYQLRLNLMGGNSEISRNFYNVYVQSPRIISEPIRTSKKVALLKPEGTDRGDFTAVLADLGIKMDEITAVSGAKGYDVLIVPPSSSRPSALNTEENRKALMTWVGNGGLLLSLEQAYDGKVWLGGALQSGDNTFVDVVVPGHPIFAGLSPQNFDTWNHPQFGHVVSYGFAPFTVNALAARGPFCGSRGVLNAVAEGSFGKGRIIVSQLNATALWGIDSVASTYMHNLLKYALGNDLLQNVREWAANRRDIELSADQVKMIDLRPFANKSFSDEVSGDHVGGWTDQGDNDFRMIPLGTRSINGVPFTIIDPASNNDASCLILKGPFRPYFPEKIDGIKVDASLKQLYFLHCLSWGNGDGVKVGQYSINYDDGTSVAVPLKDGINVADWYNPGDLAEALTGITAKHRSGADVGMWVYVWDNPNPEKRIISIDFSSTGKSAMPILVALSGRL